MLLSTVIHVDTRHVSWNTIGEVLTLATGAIAFNSQLLENIHQDVSRAVLLKKYTWEGFIFYTNYNSEKGKSIAKNPNVCLSFLWHNIERQVIIKGVAEKIAENLSDGYFESRPDGSKLGAWASNQSEPVPSRKFLDDRLLQFEKQFKNTEIPRPKHWGGYIVKPISIEFWQGRPNRMHDRIRYTLQEDFNWKIERLAP